MNIIKKVAGCIMICAMMSSLIACEDIETEMDRQEVASAVVDDNSDVKKNEDISEVNDEQKENKNDDDDVVIEREEAEESDSEKTEIEDKETESEKPKKETEKKMSPEKKLRLDYIKTVAGIIDECDDDMGRSEEEMLNKNQTEYQALDLILNKVYEYLKANMAPADFKKLEADEVKWIKEKEAAMVKESEGLDGDYKEVRRLSTAVSYTQDRCYYLIMLIGDDETGKRKLFYEDVQNVHSDMEPLSELASQHEMNLHSQERYENIKGLYAEIYEYHRQNMSEDEFKDFEKEESRWEKERDAAIKEELEIWGGGSMSPLIANGLGTALTNERCYYLIALID